MILCELLPSLLLTNGKIPRRGSRFAKLKIRLFSQVSGTDASRGRLEYVEATSTVISFIPAQAKNPGYFTIRLETNPNTGRSGTRHGELLLRLMPGDSDHPRLSH
jgi:hypothetical protein